MKPYEARRRALLAVAKLSIFASAVGCSGGVVVLPGESEEYEAEVTPEATPETPSSAVPYDVPIHPPAPEAATACFVPDTDVEACCNQALTSAFADDHLFADPTLATADEQACCDLVFDTMINWDGTAELPFDWTHQNNCCVLDQSAALCSPWGPPMPPKMPRVRRGREVLS